MSWDVNYHREKLEHYDGHKWQRVPDVANITTLDGAVRYASRLQKRLKYAKLLRFVGAFLAVAFLVLAVAGGILWSGGYWLSLVGTGLSLILWASMEFAWIEDLEDQVLTTSETYRKLLDAAVSS